ncbi:DNA polymerase IV [Aeromicrobium sp. CnD17-E]|uniref:DNA polymerase IV n=1 Tax=Aeromicrobium sp. CnD17-E TaxID=2954487 RepID=UPI002096AD30|nr:DNA polymerase IV [Aeromicrobium sp. CnD17-E]MCO7238715.1 DNA polymerase IV [Aeromicrobium sp. CnD17-E]
MQTSAEREGTVLHADLDSFFASVEIRDDPSLRGRPVAVGGGVVMAASYEARAHGVKGAMGLRQALRLCPDLLVVPPRPHAYSEASRAVFAVFADTTPLVEGVSIDEAFLEVGGLRRIRGAPSQIATTLREQVRERVGLPISVGVARTKYLAKVASAMAKPDGLLVVPLDDERRFLLSLPVQALWGVGPRTTEKLHAARVRTVADVARMQPGELATLVGSGAAGHLHALASGHDPRPVRARPSRRSMGAQRALGRDERTPEGVEIVLLGLVDRVARRLRAAGRTAATVTLRVRFGDFTSSTASHTLPRPTAHTQVLLDATLQLLRGRHGEIARRGVTLVGFQASGLDDQGEQLLLPLTSASDPGLDTALDAVRDRFGARAVRRGVQLGRGERAAMPILPDQEDDA